MREEISWREYFSLRPPDLKKPEYKHLWLLLYWPLELAFFAAAGRLPRSYHPVACALDESIPLLEGFVVPYLLWFLCGLFLLLYTLRRNIPVFRRFMDFMIVTILLCGAVFLLYPSTFPLRPVPVWPVSVGDCYRAMPRQNLFTWVLSVVYFTDPPRNVFPSMHIAVSFGMFCAVLQDRLLRRPAFSVPFGLLQLLIWLSVVFTRQHSVLDVLGALPVMLLGWFLCFRPGRAEKTAEA